METFPALLAICAGDSPVPGDLRRHRAHYDVIVMKQLVQVEWCIYASANFPSLVRIMACRLVGAEPLTEPMPK